MGELEKFKNDFRNKKITNLQFIQEVMTFSFCEDNGSIIRTIKYFCDYELGLITWEEFEIKIGI